MGPDFIREFSPPSGPMHCKYQSNLLRNLGRFVIYLQKWAQISSGSSPLHLGPCIVSTSQISSEIWGDLSFTYKNGPEFIREFSPPSGPMHCKYQTNLLRNL